MYLFLLLFFESYMYILSIFFVKVVSEEEPFSNVTGLRRHAEPLDVMLCRKRTCFLLLMEAEML